MTYYVNSICGDDNADGITEKTPFRTIERLNRADVDGTTKIMFRANGIYHGMLTVCGMGCAEESIEIGAYGIGKKPVINADGEFAGIFAENLQNVRISGLEITNFAVSDDKERCGLFFCVGGEGEKGGVFRNICIENLCIHNIVTCPSRQAGGVIFDTRLSKTPVCYENVTIQNCTVKNTQGNGITFTSAYSSRVGIDWASGEYFPSTNVVIKNNFIYNVGGDGIFQSCAKNPVIENNTVYRSSWAGNTPYAGIWPHNSTYAVMRCNESYGQKLVCSDAQGFDVDIDCTDTLVEHNYSHDNEGGFILICTSGDQGGFNKRVTVRHNISENDKGQIFTLSGPVEDIRICNNTVIVREGLDTRLIGMYQWGDSGGGPRHVLIDKNIFNINGRGCNCFYPETDYSFRGNLYKGTYDFSDIKDEAPSGKSAENTNKNKVKESVR